MNLNKRAPRPFGPGFVGKYRKGYQRASEQIMQAIRNAAELHQKRRLASPGEVAAKGSSIAAPVGNGRIVPIVAATRQVPVVSWARAGEAEDYGDLCNQIDEMIEVETKDPNAFALIVEGDSMEPRFHAGDRVVFAPNSEPRNGNFVVARLREGFGVLFKVFRRKGPEGQIIRLESLNPEYKPKEYPTDAFRFIYPAVEAKLLLRT